MVLCAHCGEVVEWREGCTWRQSPPSAGRKYLVWHAQGDGKNCYLGDAANSVDWHRALRMVAERGKDRVHDYLPWW